jgi:gluconate kinase
VNHVQEQQQQLWQLRRQDKYHWSINDGDDYDSSATNSNTQTIVTIVSFSFVNTDLRTVFRQRFPHANWVLINTTETEAQRRIEQRQGHFYKGKQQQHVQVEPNDPIQYETTKTTMKDMTTGTKQQNDDHDNNNSDWEFAPVTFDHVVLPGTDSS